MPLGGREIDNRKRKDIEKWKDIRELLGPAGSVARGWCDFKNFLDFRSLLALAGMCSGGWVGRLLIIGRINTTIDRFPVLRRFQGVSLGTIRQPGGCKRSIAAPTAYHSVGPDRWCPEPLKDCPTKVGWDRSWLLMFPARRSTRRVGYCFPRA